MNADALKSVVRSYPESPEAWNELSRLCAQGTAIRFSGLDRLDPVKACLLIDFFLHGPEVAGPVEPFSTLLSALERKEDVSLWDLAPETAGPRGLACSPQTAKPGTTHCGYFALCHGYGACTGSCGTWQAIFARLEAAAEEKQRLSAH